MESRRRIWYVERGGQGDQEENSADEVVFATRSNRYLSYICCPLWPDTHTAGSTSSIDRTRRTEAARRRSRDTASTHDMDARRARKRKGKRTRKRNQKVRFSPKRYNTTLLPLFDILPTHRRPAVPHSRLHYYNSSALYTSIHHYYYPHHHHHHHHHNYIRK